MALIRVEDLTFSYETNYENIFEHVSFQMDTDWKLGFIGRNGRGKTTFMRLLMGDYAYSGLISAPVDFDYFPFAVENPDRLAREVARNLVAPFTRWEEQMELLAARPETLEEYGEVLQRYQAHGGYEMDAMLERELSQLGVELGALKRPFSSLSQGEQTKIRLAALFLKKNHFLLIDEPTNHLDMEGRQLLGDYLAGKKGFILVSHDRVFLDRTVDHVLSINRRNIEVQKGNFSSWQQNKQLQDQFELEREEKLKKDISRLKQAARQKADWSDRIEATKIGTHSADRGAVGHRAAKMMKRAKTIEARQQAAIEEKSGLLQNVEQAETLKIQTIPYVRSRLLLAEDLTVRYGAEPLFRPVTFSVEQGDRVALMGRNGSGKSSVIRSLQGQPVPCEGSLWVGRGLEVSYVSQDTSFLSGSLKDFAAGRGIDESLFKAILRKLDFSRNQFEKDMAELSQGQKKKVLLAASLSRPAHLYLWDEPLNFVDVLSRMQLEELLLSCRPTMVFIEHDRAFVERVATKRVALRPWEPR